jgi:hypothetical protein
MQHSSEGGQVTYLLYNLQGAILPDLGSTIVPFKVVDENRVSQQEVTLKNIVVASAAGQSLEVILGNQATGITMLPVKYALHQAYPNPFNPMTAIKFDLPEDGLATIRIYNLLGQQVRTLVDQDMPAGRHLVQWHGTDDTGRSAPTGIYFIRFTAGGVIQHNKIMLLK